MSRVRYISANGEEPPLTEFEREKLKGQQLANAIARTKLRRIQQDLLEKCEVRFVVETMAVVLRQELMRLPSLVAGDIRGLRLTREQLFAVRVSVDRTVRSALEKAADALGKALDPRKAIAELVGEKEPSRKAVDAAARKKARASAKRRVRRKATA